MAMVEFSPETPRSAPLPDSELHEHAGLFIPQIESLLNNTNRIIMGITQDDQGTKIERFGDREGKRVGELVYRFNSKTGLWECNGATYFAGWNNDDPHGPRACVIRAERSEKMTQLPNGMPQKILSGVLEYRPSGDQLHFNTPHAAEQIRKALRTSLSAFGIK